MSIANWNSITQYLFGDTVYYAPDTYFALQPNIDILPPTLAPNWAIRTPAPFAPSYAEFVSDTTQPLVAGVITPLTFDVKNIGTPDIVPAGAFPNAIIRTQTAGTYRLIYSAQVDKTGGGGTNAFQFFFTLNGNPIPNTATEVDITQQINDLMTVESFFTLNAGDGVGVSGFVPPTATNTFVASYPISPTVPVSIPSIIFNIQRIE